MTRYARKVDTTQSDIVAALRAAGWLVWIIEEPCDLLCYRAGIWKTVECKTPKNKRGDPRIDKRQVAQNEFIALTGTPRATNPHDAVAALGGVTFGGAKPNDYAALPCKGSLT